MNLYRMARGLAYLFAQEEFRDNPPAGYKSDVDHGESSAKLGRRRSNHSWSDVLAKLNSIEPPKDDRPYGETTFNYESHDGRHRC